MAEYPPRMTGSIVEGSIDAGKIKVTPPGIRHALDSMGSSLEMLETSIESIIATLDPVLRTGPSMGVGEDSSPSDPSDNSSIQATIRGMTDRIVRASYRINEARGELDI
jgi:hypothetical protein